MIRQIRITIVGSVVLILAFVIGCGGGNVTPAPVTAPTPVVETPNTGLGDTSSAVFQVRMKPQEPIAIPFKGMSFASPNDLHSLLPPPKQLSWIEEDLTKNASAYETGLPKDNVTNALPPNAVFMPSWDPNGNPAPDGLAYAMYSFSMADYDQEPDQTISFGWATPPVDFDLFWVGFGNDDNNAWDWFAGPSDDVLTIDSYTPYISPTGNVLLALVVMGTEDCVLEQIKIGDYEIRGTGDLYDEGETPDNTPPLDAGAPPSSVDLAPECSPINDQGHIGSCSAFAVGDAAYNYELGQIYGEYGWDFSDPFNLVSPKYLYIESGKDQGLGCPEQGRYTGQVIDWLEDYGVATELNAPYGSRSPGPNWCDDEWSTEATEDAGLLDIEGWQAVNCNTVEGIQSVKAILAYQHRVLVMRTNLDTAFCEYTSGVWDYSGPYVGGHAMGIVGYDDSLQAFKVRNSWGDEWPAGTGGGHIWVSYDTFLNADARVRCWYLWDEYDPDVASRFCSDTPAMEPPTGVEASDGEFTDKIAVSWNPVDGAEGYRVFRDNQDNEVADIPGTGWNDTTVEDYLAHTYWVTAYSDPDESDYSAPDTGYLAQAPVIDGVAPTSGVPGQDVTFTATVHGSTPMTYSWNFGGGATPNTSTNATPDVTLGDEGEYYASLTVTNEYGADEYQFTLMCGFFDITIISLTTDKKTHFADGGDAAAATITVVADPAPDTVIWAVSPTGSVTGSGTTVTYKPSAGTSPGVVTITCTVHFGAGQDSRSIEMYLTEETIKTNLGVSGRYIDFTGYPSNVVPNAPYRPFSYYMDSETAVLLNKWGIW